MTPYKTNSALYLDYLAATHTREQIEADPRLCVFLNNPYIKDNMEIALLYNAARTGDYADKMSFVEYLMCNGPELDADTILHYRTKVALDPVCTEIAYSYYADVDHLEDLREKKYNKGKKGENCFTKPCFYMGRFSSAVGDHASVENAKSMWNCFADAFKPSASDRNASNAAAVSALTPKPGKGTSYVGKLLGGAAKKGAGVAGGALGAATNGAVGTNNDAVQPSGGGDAAASDDSPLPAKKSLWGWIPNSLQKGWSAIESLVGGNFREACNNLRKAGNLDAEEYGDPFRIAFSKKTEILKNANIRRQMGDCARLWDLARQLEIYNPAQNARGPSTPDAVGNTGHNGVPRGDNTSNPLSQNLAGGANTQS